MSKDLYWNKTSNIDSKRKIYFIINLDKLKVTKIFKDSSYIESLKPNYEDVLYECPIYGGNIIYIGDSGTKGISLKRFANQCIEIFKKLSKPVNWEPTVGINRGPLKF